MNNIDEAIGKCCWINDCIESNKDILKDKSEHTTLSNEERNCLLQYDRIKVKLEEIITILNKG